ncbi:type I DNA topoisomerase [Candidatus Saccharibacteria bacterium]|nr:type I DNA topoisomerase [Candidatus Saccharibacteria bacterium]
MPKNLVIVESPAKAHTIEKYLGADYKVLASVGHIRKDTKVDKSTFDVTYEIDPGHKSIIAELKKEARAADKIWLATDEDREGESISWHLSEVLKLPKDTARITFHEITKPALLNAIQNPRVVDMDMVASQQARQTLDMLVGYDLSDIVRRKVPGAVSAGRVQSPALRLVVEQEKKIEKFEGKASFKVTGEFATKNAPSSSTSFAAAYDGTPPDNEAAATELLQSLAGADFVVEDVEETEGTKANPVPFTTAALQIEANAKLGFSSRTTMSAAQGLYQAGLITYHRTDSLNLSSQAIGAISGYIKDTFGANYLKVRHFKTKDASAQEAHEAIRPTDVSRLSAGKNNYEKRLYELIWARTVATQMANAKVAKTAIRIKATSDSARVFRSAAARELAREPRGDGSERRDPSESDAAFIAKGEVVIFDGFLKVYGKSKDLELPHVSKGDKMDCLSLKARQTFAKPPARYTEGSLVKKLEELGIGRPSTYASIMSAIQARGYVIKGESEGSMRDIVELSVELGGSANTGAPSAKKPEVVRSVVQEKYGANKGRLVPTPIGELVAGFLTENFKNIVDYKFTANIEKDLDLVADAKLERVKMLRDFYGPFHDTVLIANGVERYNNARLLGHHPESGLPIYAKIGKTGGFIQLGENEKESGEKPRFAPLPARKSVKTVTLEQALKQLALPALPRELGKAKDGAILIAANGPFGPYLKAGKYNVPLGDLDPYTVTLEEALPLYQKKIDSMIADWGDIQIINGAYGPYVKGPGRRNNAKIPKDVDPKTITKEQAEEMLKNKPKTTRRGVRGGRKKGATKTKKSASAKTSKKTTKK